MMQPSPELEARLRGYVTRNPGLVQVDSLGGGTDGHVWASNRDTAIKVLERREGYLNERDAYLRLREFGWTKKIGEFYVPAMLAFDDDLLVVEMSFMQRPPFVIDFAKSRLNIPYEFSEQTLSEFERDGANNFGANWPRVKVLLEYLESILLFYLDPKPGNIVFAPDDRP